MISLQGCCTLCSILMFVRGNLGVLINIHQEVVNGIVGQSVLLPLSYRFSRAPRFPVSIVWMFTNDMDVVVSCTLLNCSLGAGGDPSNCSANRFPQPAYRGRAELFPENGSLLLRDLQLSDSGVYSVSFRPSYQTRRLVLTVHEQRSTPEHPGERKRKLQPSARARLPNPVPEPGDCRKQALETGEDPGVRDRPCRPVLRFCPVTLSRHPHHRREGAFRGAPVRRCAFGATGGSYSHTSPRKK
ncbi:uncharacterized protein LOC142415255 isoform X1 [Mycteria americana]|uniref:uncharacterized protein LOC142415255 isoform X1 n=1 Tax=Mycteria americana TaxID=33587 RepID=UPI003F585607